MGARTTIHDLTKELLAPAIDWQLQRRQRDAQFCETTRAILEGLYVGVYVNASDHDVWDANTDPKVVIRARSAMLKFGKFERGVLTRYEEMFRHFRRVPPGAAPELWIFRELTRFVLVLDLTPLELAACSCAAVFEPFWNGSIEAWLGDRVAGKQSKRQESRHLVGPPPTPEELMPLLTSLQERIEVAAAALAARSDSSGEAKRP